MNTPEGIDFRFGIRKFEEEWVGTALEDFQEEGWLSGVLYRVKGGKEAQVYCCKADPDIGVDLIAADLWRRYMHREL